LHSLRKGMFLEANLTAITLLGLNRSALLKLPLTRYILPDDQDIYYLHRKQLFETGEPQTCDLRMVKNDGTQFYDEAQVMAGEHIEQPNAFLGKPYQLKGLRETISRVLAE